MFTIAQEEQFFGYDFFSALPERVRGYIHGIQTDSLMEIRLRTGSAISLIYPDGAYFVSPNGRIGKDHSGAVCAHSSDIERGLELITKSSVYAYENEIKNGFITLSGGHRVGICGDAVTCNGHISHIRAVQALNYRFAREIIGAADSIMPKIYDGVHIKNTILVSPPMRGKTTLLRDIARQLSLAGKRVSIMDERGEIAAISSGISPFNLGVGCDVLSGVNKAEGMLLMLRSMSPDVIITDEIGGDADFEAVREIKKRGVSVITSLHGENQPCCDFELSIYLEGIGKC